MELMPVARSRAGADVAVVEAAPHGHAEGEEHGHAAGAIEWEDDMVEVNRAPPRPTALEARRLRYGAAGKDINWRFTVGDQVKIRLVSEMESDHPMHHPFHIHGAGRFLVLAREGVVEPNLVWTDTVLITPGYKGLGRPSTCRAETLAVHRRPSSLAGTVNDPEARVRAEMQATATTTSAWSS